MINVPFRIGHGYDVHAFEPGDHLMLCGVKVPHDRQFKAHSDGDVAIHALCDAILGAAALGDIGLHFPDNDDAYKGADSRQLLKQCLLKAAEQGWQPGNVDITIAAQAPKLRPYIGLMQKNLAETLDLTLAQVNVKATTTEKLGFVGRQEGVEAHAVVLLVGA